MTEHNKEQHKSSELDQGSKEAEALAREKLNEIIERGKDVPHDLHEKAEDARHEAKQEALSRDEILATHEEEEPEEPQMPVNNELKGMAYQRTLNRIRKDLSAPERSFSKVIHNKAVENFSEVAGKTVARPSGLLFGGIFAFIGSSLFLWASKHYGYEYNFLLFALFFVAGFALGLLLEILFRVGKKAKRKKR